MKTFKQIINEINEPRAGKQWSDYTHSMFGSEPFARNINIVPTSDHIKWLKSKLTHVPWTYGVPADPPVRVDRLPVTHIKENGEHIEVHVDPTNYLKTIRHHNITDTQAQQIPEFADDIEDSSFGSSYGEAETSISRQLFHKINLDNIDLHHGVEGISRPNMVFWLRNNDVKGAHEKHTRDLDPHYDTIEDDDVQL